MHRLPAAAALAAALLAVPVIARTAESAPGAPLTLVVWSQRIGQELDRRMYFPSIPLGREKPSGVVRVKFACSESGRPDQVSVYQSSGNRWLDKAALDAVRKVATLHPLPDGMSHQQRYVATLLFAQSPEDYDRQIGVLRAAAVNNNAWFKGAPAVALLDTPAHPES